MREAGEPDPARLDGLRRLLSAQGVRPKKSFGQSFLVDPELRDRIVAAARIRSGDEVLEIGSGPGTLTVRLAGAARRLVAVELDPGLVAILRRVVTGRPGIEIRLEDILKMDIAGAFPQGGEVVVGNIPYNLTGALLRRMLEREPRPRRLALVVQREVARRWTGESGWSLATVAAQVFTEPRVELELPAGAFWPEPRVDSSLVTMDVRPSPAVPEADLGPFFRLVESSFQFRRKQLRGGLARVYGLSAEAVGEGLRRAGVEPSRRPETLGLEEWRAVLAAFGPLS